jgi:hypothetical protein
MGSDLVALFVGVALAVVVVFLGWRRNLAAVTQGWLPRFGKVPKPATVAPGLGDGGQRSRQLSPRQRRLGIWLYLAISIFNLTLAVLSADSRFLHAISAALFALGAAVFVLRKPSSPAT